jgi:hypothetical protein
MRTQRQPLRRLYAELNRRFFDGHLPTYRVRRAPFADPWMDAFRRGSGGRRLRQPRRRWADRLGDCDSAAQCIRVSDSLSADEERRVLLHEMCHAATPGDDHGPRWCQMMRRLAEQGETWAAEEADEYEA